MPKFQLYETVRVVRLPPAQSSEHRSISLQIGDVGAVVMVYDSPLEGYTVEAVADDGHTKWLADFAPEDLEKA